MTDGVSLADIAAVTERNDGMFGGGNGGMWIFALLILLLIGGGGFFNGNRGLNGEPVTESGLCNAMNFNNLENAVGRISDNAQQNYMGLQNGLCNLGYESLRNFNTLQQQVSECCCGTQRAIDGVNYNGAINTAAINANTTAQTQKVLDALQQNRIDTLQAQVNQLQLQSALCGVVRYPNSITYNGGVSPFCGYGQTCNGNMCNI